MADFPINPIPGETFVAPDGTVWEWDGYSWKTSGAFGAGGIANVAVSANSTSSVNANGINFMAHVYFALRPEKAMFLRSMIAGWITRGEFEKAHDPDRWQVNE